MGSLKKKALNFVCIASPHMRAVEDQLSSAIGGALRGWTLSQSHLKPVEGVLNFTFFVTRPAQVFMSHGVADKNYLLRRDRKGRPVIARYDRVLVPGPWLRDRLLSELNGQIDPAKIQSVGWPRIDALRARQSEMGADDTSARRRRVLWAPTLSGEGDTSSYPALMAHIPALRRDFDLAISVHPADRGGGPTTFDQLLWADVVISDHGTLVYEAWALGKPVIFPSWLIGDAVQRAFPGSAESHLFAQGIGEHATGIDDLTTRIEAASGVEADVEQFMGQYLDPTGSKNSAQKIAESVIGLSNGYVADL